jgi:uncharacterized protein YjiS (DUF1127 family)
MEGAMARPRFTNSANHRRTIRVSRRYFVATKLWRPRRLLALVLLWHERARQRDQLRQLDAHALRDIGITREEALRESWKPFWRG